MKFLCFLVECRLEGGCRLGGKGQYSIFNVFNAYARTAPLLRKGPATMVIFSLLLYSITTKQFYYTLSNLLIFPYTL